MKSGIGNGLRGWRYSVILPLIIGVMGTGAAMADEPVDWQEAVILDGRLRWETADMDGLEASEALTLRTRLGLQSPDWNGWTGLIEGEFTVPAKSDSYDAWPGSQGEPGHTVIADPRNTELNRAQVSYRKDGAALTIGRQRILRNNVRFIGNVGWRQNEQTYDAVLGSWHASEDVELVYGYLDRANRIFGKYAEVETQRYFEMESHILEAVYSGLEGIQLGGYAYLLRMENSPGASSDTIGAWMTGKRNLSEDLDLSWRLELARQEDNHASPDGAGFDLDYYHITAGLIGKSLSLELGVERLEGENGLGFATPLATLHAFNGFADVFLGTPGRGLRDAYARLSGTLPGGVKAALVYHRFESGEGTIDYGDEWDAVASYKVNANLSLTGKLAFYSGDSGAPGSLSSDVSKFWLQMDFSY